MSSLIESVTSYMSETGDPLVSENMVQGADPGASSQAEVSGTENVNLTEESGNSVATGTGDAGTAINTVSSEASSGNVTEEAVKAAADSDPASRALELLKALQSGQTSKADTDNVLQKPENVNTGAVPSDSPAHASSITEDFSRAVDVFRQITGEADYKPADLQSFLKDISAIS